MGKCRRFQLENLDQVFDTDLRSPGSLEPAIDSEKPISAISRPSEMGSIPQIVM